MLVSGGPDGPPSWSTGTGAVMAIPALAKTKSRRLEEEKASLKASAREVYFVTSAWWKVEPGIFAAAADPVEMSRSMRKIFQLPREARASATARPMPLAPPVIRAVRISLMVVKSVVRYGCNAGRADEY